MVKWLEASGLDRVATKILDLGTGNGHLLGRLVGQAFVFFYLALTEAIRVRRPNGRGLLAGCRRTGEEGRRSK